jgi:mono/diheme cytochrome c family protein
MSTNRINRITLLGMAALFLGVTGAAFSTLSQAEKTQEPVIKKVPIERSTPESGKQMYMDYCAVCHGQDGKGGGPAAAALKAPPSDLTQMAKKAGGESPFFRVKSALQFGSSIGAHGTSDMPVWGPLFRAVSGGDAAQVQLRMNNLAKYVESLQEK